MCSLSCTFSYFHWKRKLAIAGLQNTESLTKGRLSSIFLKLLLLAVCDEHLLFISSIVSFPLRYLYLYLLFYVKNFYKCCLNNVDLTESRAEQRNTESPQKLLNN